MSAVLECRGLRRAFGQRLAVDDVSFTVAAGETYGLLGPNGAGKTTTISMVVGILRRHGGTVTIDGISLEEAPLRAREHVGYVPQELALYPDLTGRENLAFFGRLYGLGGRALATRLDEALEAVGLTERAGDRTSEYSGGMKRRLNIAVGLLCAPRLLILDEPTVGVDPQSRAAIIRAVEDLRRTGMGVLYTTHYMEEAERLCDRIGIMDAGRLIAEGTRSELVQLIQEHDAIDVRASGDLAAAAGALGRIDGVVTATPGDGEIHVVADGASRHIAEIVRCLGDAGLVISAVDVAEPNLESVFLHLTGRALRD